MIMQLLTISRGLKNIVEGFMLSISGPIVSLKRALQSWRWLWLATFVFLLCISPSLGAVNSGTNTGDSKNSESLIFELDTGNGTSSVSRGISVKVTGDYPEDIKSGKSIPKLKLFGEDQPQTIKGNSDKDGSVWEFVIPEGAKLGEYSPRLLFFPIDMQQDVQDAKPLKAIAVRVKNSDDKHKHKLTINSEAGYLEPTITSISPPRVIFPYQSNSHPPRYHAYSFNVFGSGFSSTPSDNHLVLFAVSKGGQDSPTFTLIDEPTICWKNSANEFIDKTCDNKKNVIGKVLSNRQLAFKNFAFNKFNNDVNGELGIGIRVGDKLSTDTSIITLSRVPYQAPLAWAVFGLLSVAAIIVAILSNSRKDKSRPSLNALIIDPDTNTYSLSRFQFVLWTIVAILSYLFLFFSKSLAQGKLEFIDIPNGLPGIVLASAATTFFAIGIDNTKGGKASGPDVDPAWSDLISAGGSVLPDRLQFFAWTIIGVFVYAFTALFQNPGVISDLPAIPDGFLQLSGISAVGYLGGKLARKPGPNITSIDKVTHDGFFLTLVLNGQNLSKDASLILTDNDKMIIKVPQIIGLTNDPEDKDKTKATIQIVNAEPGDSTLASKLMIKIPSPPAKWPLLQDYNYDISIINPDSQIAALKFSGLKVEDVKAAEAKAAEAKAAADVKAAADLKAAIEDAAKAATDAKAAEDAAKTAAAKAAKDAKTAEDAKAEAEDAKTAAAAAKTAAEAAKTAAEAAKTAAEDAKTAATNANTAWNTAKEAAAKAAADPKSSGDAAKSVDAAAKSADAAKSAAEAAAKSADAAKSAAEAATSAANTKN